MTELAVLFVSVTVSCVGHNRSVKERIIKELEYQSSMELNDVTFEVVR